MEGLHLKELRRTLLVLLSPCVRGQRSFSELQLSELVAQEPEMGGQRKKGQNKRVNEHELQDRLLRGRVQYLRCGALFFCLLFYQSQSLLGLEPELRCNMALAAIPGGHPFRDDSSGYIYRGFSIYNSSFNSVHQKDLWGKGQRGGIWRLNMG